MENNFSNDLFQEIMEEDLILPSIGDYSIIDYVRKNIYYKDVDCSGCFMPSSLAVQKSMALRSIENAYGIDAHSLAKTLLNGLEIRKTGGKHEYHINSISNEPVSMTVPSITNSISHVFIAREAIEGIKNVNKKEYALKYKCGSVVTIFHELVEAFNSNEKKCDYIVNKRLAELKGECIEEKETIFDTTNRDYDFDRAILLHNDADLLSYYYAVRLFNIYLKRPFDVLGQVKRVVLGQMTTQELLNYYGLLDMIDFEDYEKAIYKLQNKTLR